MNERRIAILIDGAYFLRRLPKLVPKARCASADKVTSCIRQLCRSHVSQLTGSGVPASKAGSKAEPDDRWHQHVYRILYYDAQPYEGKSHNPIANQQINFGNSLIAKERRELFDCLRRQRKFALRLGKVNVDHDWTIKPALTRQLLKTRQAMSLLSSLEILAEGVNESTLTLDAASVRSLVSIRDLWAGLKDGDVSLGLRQKGVDMRIGIDIASLALKKQVDTIVLVAGDSDFVPAAKLARREGIDFILDPLWQSINPDLHEHIDGLQSGFPKPSTAKPASAAAVTPPDPEQTNGP